MTDPLVTALMAKQSESDLTLRQLARILEVSPALLSLTLRDERPVGMAILRAVLRVYPDLEELVTASLKRINENDEIDEREGALAV